MMYWLLCYTAQYSGLSSMIWESPGTSRLNPPYFDGLQLARSSNSKPHFCQLGQNRWLKKWGKVHPIFASVFGQFFQFWMGWPRTPAASARPSRPWARQRSGSGPWGSSAAMPWMSMQAVEASTDGGFNGDVMEIDGIGDWSGFEKMRIQLDLRFMIFSRIEASRTGIYQQ